LIEGWRRYSLLTIRYSLPLSSEENKSLHDADCVSCLFCKNREEKIDLEASRCGF